MNEVARMVENVEKGVALMVQRQQLMNLKVDPEWWKAGFKFHRAAWTELGEGMQYLSWEWWKKAEGQYKNEEAFGHYCLELVDALHFVTSMVLQEAFGKLASPAAVTATLPEIAKKLSDYLGQPSTGCYGHLYNKDVPGASLPDLTEDAALCCLYKLPKNAYSYLISAAIKAGIGFSGLLAFYVGKSVLNVFRQDNGYKAGTYVKIWDSKGNEDNLYLADAIIKWLEPLTEEQVFEKVFSEQLQNDILHVMQTRYDKMMDMINQSRDG